QALVLLGAVAAAEVWTANVADEERIAGENHRRLGAARWVDDEQRNQLGAVARRVDNLQPELPQLEYLVVFERVKRISHRRRLVQTKRRLMLRGQRSGARHVIRVDVRVDHVTQRKITLAQQRLVLVDLNRRVDDRRLVGLARGN